MIDPQGLILRARIREFVEHKVHVVVYESGVNGRYHTRLDGDYRRKLATANSKREGIKNEVMLISGPGFLGLPARILDS